MASDSVFARSAVSWSLPARLPRDFGIAVYSAIERIAPAPYVEAMLARAALENNDPNAAQVHAGRLPVSAARDELLGDIAMARGARRQAENSFIAAADVFAIDALVDQLSKRNTAAAYTVELRLVARLQLSATHPDALAQAYWRLGRLAAQIGYAHPQTRRIWFERAMRDYERAVGLSPLSERYLIAIGVQALNLSDLDGARRYFRRAADLDPASADAYAGLGTAALRLGDRAGARAYAEQSRANDPHSHFLRSLELELRQRSP